MGKQLTTNQFIEKARKIHGEKYDYSKVEYKKSCEKVCIICPIHGEFWQTPNEHLSGYGCRKCGIEHNKLKQTFSLETFIERAKKVHGDKYDYSKSEYKGALTKTCIICHEKDKNGVEHGEFWQTPANHVNEHKGCPKCGLKSIWDKRGRVTTEDFVNRAREVHGDKYNYSKVEYAGDKTKVCIICSEHGEFWQTPYKHLSGQGCPECGLKSIWDKRGRVTTEDFVNRAREVHGDKYNYSKVEYERNDRKVRIICPEHGEFLQTPNKHLSGQGCPECSNRINTQECLLWRKLQKKYPNIEILHEYHNTEIFGKKSIDIYFPKNKIGIEYQGGQHFRPIKIFGGYNGFLKVVERDKEKYKECKDNGIKLFYFTTEKWGVNDGYIDKVYTRFDELCEEIDKELICNAD